MVLKQLRSLRKVCEGTGESLGQDQPSEESSVSQKPGCLGVPEDQFWRTLCYLVLTNDDH